MDVFPALVTSRLGRPNSRAWRWLLIGGIACSPEVSQVPLGLGPLALAERRADEEAARPDSPSPSPDSPAAAGAAQPDEEADDDDDEEAPADEQEEPADGASSDDDDDEGDPTAGVVRFAGSYSGTDVLTYRIENVPERSQTDDQAKIRIDEESPTEIRIVIINTATGEDMHALRALVSGNLAEIEPGQPCFAPEGQTAFAAEVMAGTALLEGDRLTLEARGELSLEIADQQVHGDLEYTFEGSR